MMKGKVPKNVKRWLWISLPLVLFIFWFLTAPAAMAVERIAAGGGNSSVARVIIRLAGAYEAPMTIVGKIGFARKMNESLANFWCDLLQAPETTP